RRLERELAEEPVELRHAGAEGQLVAVLLLELQDHVDLVVRVGGLLDLNRLPFERLEVPELVEAADAELQRLRVEHARLQEPQLATDDVVPRRGVADEGDAV